MRGGRGIIIEIAKHPHGWCRVALLTGVLTFATAAHADITVPSGGSMALGGANVDLGCSDVTVAGTLSLQGGALTNVRNVTIAPGGSIVAGSGGITLAGNWANQGDFTAGTGSVNFVDVPACASTSAISGSTTFATLSFVSTSGKLYSFAVGSTQSITSQLTATGTAALPLRLQSSVLGQFAFINLSASGLQTMNELAVSDLAATGIRLAPLLTNRNLSPTAGAIGWFAEPTQIVPTAHSGSLLALSFSLFLFGIAALRRFGRTALNRKD